MKTFEELKLDEKLALMARNAKPHRNRKGFKVRETSNGIITIINKRRTKCHSI